MSSPPAIGAHAANAAWPRMRLGDVCRVVGGSTPKTGVDAFWNGDIVWVTPSDLGRLESDHIGNSDRLIAQSGYDSCGAEMVPPGSVVMSSRAPIGHLAIAAVPLCTNQGCKTFVPSPDVDSEFLFYRLKQAVPDLRALGSGATFAEVSKGQCEAFEIPLPPLPEQRRIAAALRGQLNAAARMRAAAEAQAIVGARLAVAAHRTEFVGMQIHKLPLAEHAIFLPARSTTTTGDALVPVATSGCLSPSAFNPSGIVTNRMWSSDLEAARLRQGEVLVARSNTAELVGQSAMYDGHPEEVYAADLTIRLWPRAEVDARYLAHSLTFVWSTGYWRERAVGASWTMKKLSRRLLGQVAIPVPSLEEQRLVVRRLDDRLRRIAAMNRLVIEQAAEIGRLPEALLRCAFLAPR